MNMNKKKVVVVALAVSLVEILSFGTVAWFSAEDKVTNKFMVATSDDGPDSIFSVNLFERVDTDGDGILDDENDYDDIIWSPEGYEYKDILPGDDLGKKPTIRNTGSYDQYIRVKVTINNASVWKGIFTKYGLTLDNIFLGHDEAEWTRNDAEITEDATDDTMTYVYYLDRILEPHKDGGVDAYLFTSVKIPTQLTQEDMDAFTYVGDHHEFALDIKVEAVQTEHVGENAIEAFDTVMGN